MSDTKISALADGGQLLQTDQLVVERAGDNKRVKAASGYLGYILLRDEKTASTEGGGYTTGSYATRTLNTEVEDTNGDCSLSSNQFTLTAGTYEIYARIPCFGTSRTRSRLRNVTDGTTIILGSSLIVGTTTQADSIVVGRFTVAAGKALAVQMTADTTRATNGLGVAAQSGETEVYTVVELRRVS